MANIIWAPEKAAGRVDGEVRSAGWISIPFEARACARAE